MTDNRDDDELRKAIARHPAGKKIQRPNLRVAGNLYKCCDHCAPNYLTEDDTWETASNCYKYPNTHAVPCNEEGCIEGRMVSDF